MSLKCPDCSEEIKDTIKDGNKGQWCRNCNRQLAGIDKDGFYWWWMPPLKVDEKGRKSLPDGIVFEELKDIMALGTIDPKAEIISYFDHLKENSKPT